MTTTVNNQTPPASSAPARAQTRLPRVPHLPTRRPARPAFPVRFAQLNRLARAGATAGHDVPAMAWNLAALIASDEGDHELARDLCLDHFDRQQYRLRKGDADAFTLGLQPLVNLVRLANNAEQHHEALEHLKVVHAYAHGGRGLRLAGRVLEQPTALPDPVREQATGLLAGVAATDGVRARIGAEQWSALVSAEAGLQAREPGDVAHQVWAVACLAGVPSPPAGPVPATPPGLPASGAIPQAWADCVLALLRRVAPEVVLRGDGRSGLSGPAPSAVADTAYRELPWTPGTEVAHTRLGLDLVRFGVVTDSERVRDDLLDRALRGQDAYVCRDLLEDAQTLQVETCTVQAFEYVIDAATYTGDDLRGDLRAALSAGTPESDR